MAKKMYGELEEHILKRFSLNQSFVANGVEYTVVNLDDVGKPRPASSGGECKTDVFVAALDSDQNREEFHISVKRRGTNEFQQNKVSATIAESFFGEDWRDIIIDATSSIKDRFTECELVCPEGKHPTKPHSILLGWKLEITNKSRKLSAKPCLTEQEIKDYVYKGTNQSSEKINAMVNNKLIPGSGIAYYLLKTEEEDIATAQDVIDQMELIDPCDIGETHLVFTANNYRTDCDKADGPRPLAVSVRWGSCNGKIYPTIIFNNPLGNTGEKDMKPYLLTALENIGFTLPCELPSDFAQKYVDYSLLSIEL